MTYFTFSRALHLMKNSGAKVRRAEWNESNYIFIKLERIYFHSQHKDIYEEALYTDDILANDWEIYE